MTVMHGDCLEVMPTLEADSVDAIVTDPPYGLGFMGVKWDTYGDGKGRGPSRKTKFDQVGGNSHARKPGGQELIRMKENQRYELKALEWSLAMLRVAKPGAHLVAFGGTRTYHRLACAIEDAGWEIRDCLSWLYGSGFPKSHNGVWGGTALKPAWEPIILARKPLAGTVAANVQQHGTGGLNIDGCRIATDEVGKPRGNDVVPVGAHGIYGKFTGSGGSAGDGASSQFGRWPANVVLDEEAARLLDEQSGERPGFSGGGTRGAGFREQFVGGEQRARTLAARTFDDSGGASRFFYTAKASRAERNAGLEHRDEKPLNWSAGTQNPGAFQSPNTHRAARNHHPTVKPLDLMQWLCRLVTPKGGLILDPFCGSGTTGRAAVAEGFRFIGIEKEAEYVEIAKARIAEYAPLFGGAA